MPRNESEHDEETQEEETEETTESVNEEDTDEEDPWDRMNELVRGAVREEMKSWRGGSPQSKKSVPSNSRSGSQGERKKGFLSGMFNGL